MHSACQAQIRLSTAYEFRLRACQGVCLVAPPVKALYPKSLQSGGSQGGVGTVTIQLLPGGRAGAKTGYSDAFIQLIKCDPPSARARSPVLRAHIRFRSG